MTVLDDPQSRTFARFAGVLYIVSAVAGFFSILWVLSQLTVAGDPQASLALIAQRPGLFMAGIAGDVVMMTAEVLLSAMLFAMFRPFGQALAVTALAARLLMAAVMAAMLLPQAGIFQLATNGGAFAAMDDGLRADIGWLLRQIHDAGVWVWQVFFTVHLWCLGVLALRSGAVPRLLALGLIVGSTGYIFDSLQAFAFPDSGALMIAGGVLLGIVTLSEIGFALWLLIRGRVPAPHS